MRGIRQGRLRTERRTEDINPLDGVANLADVMLVFACGILIALIAAWNLDVTDKMNVPTEVQSLGKDTEQTLQNPDDLKAMGTVYMDPATGKYYIIDDKNN